MSKTITATLYSQKTGREYECSIDYNFSPGEPQTWDCPGEGPQVEVLSVTIEGCTRDIYPIFSSDDVEEACMDDVECQVEYNEECRAEAQAEAREARFDWMNERY